MCVAFLILICRFVVLVLIKNPFLGCSIKFSGTFGLLDVFALKFLDFKGCKGIKKRD